MYLHIRWYCLKLFFFLCQSLIWWFELIAYFSPQSPPLFNRMGADRYGGVGDWSIKWDWRGIGLSAVQTRVSECQPEECMSWKGWKESALVSKSKIAAVLPRTQIRVRVKFLGILEGRDFHGQQRLFQMPPLWSNSFPFCHFLVTPAWPFSFFFCHLSTFFYTNTSALGIDRQFSQMLAWIFSDHINVLHFYLRQRTIFGSYEWHTYMLP